MERLIFIHKSSWGFLSVIFLSYFVLFVKNQRLLFPLTHQSLMGVPGIIEILLCGFNVTLNTQTIELSMHSRWTQDQSLSSSRFSHSLVLLRVKLGIYLLFNLC